ncbi:MAG: TlpA family protein disulfide reductase, partial [Tenacibaculum sp.]
NFKKREITLNGFNFSKKIKFDKKTKSFHDTIRIDNDGYYSIKANKKTINLYLSDTVNTGIVFDYKKPEVINFEGTYSNINNYFVKKKKTWVEHITNANKFFAFEEEEFLDRLETYKDALTDLSISNNLPTEFLTSEVKNIDYEYLRNISNYQNFHSILTGNDDYKTSEDFPNAFENFNFSSGDDYMNSFSYRAMLDEELKRITGEKNKEGEDYYLTYLETIHTEVNDTIAKNDLLFKCAKANITNTAELKEFFNKFNAYSSNKAQKEEITATYNFLKTTAKGQPAPKFFNFENYNGGTTSLDDLLNKGKYLYIDVWATWCAFCKKEIPLLKKLEEEYHGKDIEFVSISVDDKQAHDKWKQTIEDREMTGIQLFSGKKQNELEWAKKFLIKGLPKFIIIDPQGNIVNPNAPAPSQGEKLINIFEDLGI